MKKLINHLVKNNKMELRELKNTQSKEFSKIWEIYQEAFPEDERRNIEKQEEILNKTKYKFLAITKNEEPVALLGDWKFNTFFFVEHIAVDKTRRGEGIGTSIFQNYLKDKNQIIVLEVERPTDKESERRIKFYEQLGFKLNKYNYIQPPYGAEKNPVPMYIMSYPREINLDEYKQIRKEIHLEVYNMKKVIKEIRN